MKAERHRRAVPVHAEGETGHATATSSSRAVAIRPRLPSAPPRQPEAAVAGETHEYTTCTRHGQAGREESFDEIAMFETLAKRRSHANAPEGLDQLVD